MSHPTSARANLLLAIHDRDRQALNGPTILSVNGLTHMSLRVPQRAPRSIQGREIPQCLRPETQTLPLNDLASHLARRTIDPGDQRIVTTGERDPVGHRPLAPRMSVEDWESIVASTDDGMSNHNRRDVGVMSHHISTNDAGMSNSL